MAHVLHATEAFTQQWQTAAAECLRHGCGDSVTADVLHTLHARSTQCVAYDATHMQTLAHKLSSGYSTTPSRDSLAAWLALADMTMRLYVECSGRIVDASFPVSRDFYHWQNLLVRGGRTGALYYGLDTLPGRLAAMPGLQTLRAGAVAAVSHLQSPWSVLTLLSEPLRQEMRLKRDSLHAVRRQQAAVLGLLAQTCTPQMSTDIGTLRLSTSNTLVMLADSLKALREAVAVDGTILHHALHRATSQHAIDQMHQIAADGHELSVQEACDLIVQVSQQLRGFANGHETKQLLTAHGRPGPYARGWIPVTVAAGIWYQLGVTGWLRSGGLAIALQQASTTLTTAVHDWLIEPALGVWRTVRHVNSVQLTTGTVSLQSDLDSLERMVCDFAREQEILSAAQLDELPGRVRQGDMSLVLRRYEQDIKHPLRSAVAGDMVRMLLIQVQKTKVDLEAALLALDKLLRANELNFALLAIIPTVALLAVGYRAARRMWRRLRGTGRRDAQAKLCASLRHCERTLNKCLHHPVDLPLPYQTQGFLIIECRVLRRYSARFLSSALRDAFAEDVQELEAVRDSSARQKLNVITRMHRTYPFLASVL